MDLSSDNVSRSENASPSPLQDRVRGEPGPDAAAEGGADVRPQALLLRPPRRLGQQQGIQVPLSIMQCVLVDFTTTTFEWMRVYIEVGAARQGLYRG